MQGSFDKSPFCYGVPIVVHWEGHPSLLRQAHPGGDHLLYAASRKSGNIRTSSRRCRRLTSFNRLRISPTPTVAPTTPFVNQQVRTSSSEWVAPARYAPGDDTKLGPGYPQWVISKHDTPTGVRVGGIVRAPLLLLWCDLCGPVCFCSLLGAASARRGRSRGLSSPYSRHVRKIRK